MYLIEQHNKTSHKCTTNEWQNIYLINRLFKSMQDKLIIFIIMNKNVNILKITYNIRFIINFMQGCTPADYYNFRIEIS